MPETYFGTPGWRGFLYLIGFIECDSSDHLRKEDDQENKLITAFEEYANFGLEEMCLKIPTPSTALPDLVSILLDISTKRQTAADVTDLI